MTHLTVGKKIAILRTRCGCERTMCVPDFGRTIHVALRPDLSCGQKLDITKPAPRYERIFEYYGNSGPDIAEYVERLEEVK